MPLKQHNIVRNPSLQEEDQLVIYKLLVELVTSALPHLHPKPLGHAASSVKCGYSSTGGTFRVCRGRGFWNICFKLNLH